MIEKSIGLICDVIETCGLLFLQFSVVEDIKKFFSIVKDEN